MEQEQQEQEQEARSICCGFTEMCKCLDLGDKNAHLGIKLPRDKICCNLNQHFISICEIKNVQFSWKIYLQVTNCKIHVLRQI